MPTAFAALLFRPAEVSDRALARGFAVALAGWDVPAPRLSIAALPGIPGFSAAFYASGAKLRRGAEDEELDHARELFDDELPPSLAVRDAAAEEGHPEAAVFALVFVEDVVYDDGSRVDAQGFERRFVRDGDDGLEAGVETPDEATIEELDLDVPEGAGEADERRAIDAAVRPHRGSTFLSRALGAPVLPALMGALFAIDRQLDVRLCDPGPDAIAGEVGRLVRALRREPGRGAFEPPAQVAGVAAPESYAAFVRAYDWADPTDPADVYRELAIGAIEGTLRFLRLDELRALDTDGRWAAAARTGLFPVAKLLGSALGGTAGARATIGLAANGRTLVLVGPEGGITAAGPELGELVRYLALGWAARSETDEQMIEALMLRAKVRATVA